LSNSRAAPDGLLNAAQRGKKTGSCAVRETASRRVA
jgi:hypothetical protein